MFLAIRKQARPLLPFIVVGAYFTLIHMITWSELRYSDPLHPLLAIILVLAGQEVLTGTGGYKRHHESSGT
jgi:hypothetical protein